MSNQPQKPVQPAKAEKKERRYFLVNPAGAIHELTYEHAKERLKSVGWRKATSEEIAELARRGGHQVHDNPICPRWSPDPDAQIELE